MSTENAIPSLADQTSQGVRAGAAMPLVLLVEDDEKFCRLLRDYLTPLGYEVEMTHEWVGIPYADMIDNVSMVQAYTSNAARLGRVVLDPAQAHKVTGSTDMGNVSYLVPSIHPMIKVAEHGVPIHSTRFAEFAGGEGGDRAVIDGAKAMAMTVVDLWASAELRSAVAAEFATRPTGVAVL